MKPPARRRWLGLAGAAAAVAFLFKQNVGAFAALGVAGYVVLRSRDSSGWLLRALQAAFALLLSVAVGVFLRPALDPLSCVRAVAAAGAHPRDAHAPGSPCPRARRRTGRSCARRSMRLRWPRRRSYSSRRCGSCRSRLPSAPLNRRSPCSPGPSTRPALRHRSLRFRLAPRH